MQLPGLQRAYPLAEVLELLGGDAAPACTDCGGVVKPDVVFFGELLPAAAIERAFALARRRRSCWRSARLSR